MSVTNTPAAPVRPYRRLLGSYLRPRLGGVLLLALLLIFGITLQLVNPQVIRTFVDATQAGAAADRLMPAALLFLAIAVVQRSAAFAAVYVGERLGWGATNDLRADLARHCLRLDMGFHKRRTPGELIERIDGDVVALGNFFSQFSVQLIGNALLVLGVLLLFFREDVRVGLILSLYTMLVFAALMLLQRLATDRWAQAHQAHAEQFGFLEEHIGGTEDIRSSGAESHVLGRLAHFGVQRMRYELRALMATNLTFVITSFLSLVGYALGLAIGAYLYMRGEATIGTAFLIVFYIGMLAEPLEGIRVQLEDLQRAGAALGRVSELLALQPLVRETDHPAPLPAGPLSVAFTDVSFAYRDDESDTRVVLHELNFALEPGQVLGLLGRTGSGKSTLTRLLFRLYDPSSGRIRLGGHLLADLALDNVRARIGMVTQEVQIFQASVRDNLTLFNDRIDDQRIFTALDELGLRAWVESLPAGLATNLGAGGMGLSAGEAQLLAFARVLLRDPGLVILDEASSRLDPATERLLEQAVDRLLAGRTAIIIAHRLQTVQRADQIMILDQGRIAEYGARRMLLADPQSQFSNLLRVGMQEVLA